MPENTVPSEPPLIKPKLSLAKEFGRFVSEQGVLGLAIGFIFGVAISDLVSSLVSDIVDPILG
ncbi:MAG: MscL family protein, partial [Patescibacteria group bacterium]